MHTTSNSCDHGGCQCGSGNASRPVPRINGIALHAAELQPDAEELQERAFTELLRQQAVAAGLLPAHAGTQAPELSEAERALLEQMVEQSLDCPAASAEECQRYYDAHSAQFVQGQSVQVRHILFAVTPGVDVQALRVRAEQVLLELTHHQTSSARFAELAATLSNCPSGAQGGDLGWIGKEECAPELAAELFHPTSPWKEGVQPRLVHSRHGFHIMEVLQRRAGEPQPYAAVQSSIAARLNLQARARALHRRMGEWVAQAQIEHLALPAFEQPLLQ